MSGVRNPSALQVDAVQQTMGEGRHQEAVSPMKMIPANNAKTPANTFPAGVTIGFTWPIPPRSMQVLRKASSQL